MTDIEKLEGALKVIREVTQDRPDAGRLFSGTIATPNLMKAHGYLSEAIHAMKTTEVRKEKTT